MRVPAYSNQTCIKMFSTNAAGLVKGKIASLLSEVNATGSNIVTIQETHSIRKGKIVKPADFVVFETIRKIKHGGTMCAVKHYLNPKLIEEYDDPFELLIVEVEVDKKGIRIMTGCGPQENLEEDKRMQFFIALEAEIVKSELAEKSTIIELDANSKLGPEHIPNDPHGMSGNGKILSNIIERHALIVANGTKECKGLVTRQRSTTNRTERSCIDLVLFSPDLREHFKELYIDDTRKHVLTRITNTKKGVIKKESDHNVLLTVFTCKIDITEKKQKVEVYNLKNKDCQIKFKDYTSNTNMLSSIFNSDEDINILAQRFIKKLNGCIKTNFRKIRINTTKKSREEYLYDKMRELKEKKDNDNIKDMKKVVEEIAKIGEERYKKLVEELDKMKPDEGKINSQKFWKLKKKLFPRSRDPPAAILDMQYAR